MIGFLRVQRQNGIRKYKTYVRNAHLFGGGRLANPLFITAAVGLAYQVLEKYGVAPDFGTWQIGVDIVSYALIGTGVYSTFNGAKPKAGQSTEK
ncbi:UNVERIFIED_CONTAM: hypothetical protein ABIC26_003753 [Paenibacillus sp. PvR008]